MLTSSLEESAEKILTYWWGVTLCPPELKYLALAECVVYEMRIAALKEVAEKTVVAKPLERLLEYSGQVIAAMPESTPNEDATSYDSTVEGSCRSPSMQFQLLVNHAAPTSGEAAAMATYVQLHLELERPLRTRGVYTVSTSSWS